MQLAEAVDKDGLTRWRRDFGRCGERNREVDLIGMAVEDAALVELVQGGAEFVRLEERDVRGHCV